MRHGETTRPDPSLLHLLVAEVAHGARARDRRTASAGAARGSSSSASSGLLFWAFIFGVLYRLLVYFRGVPEIGPLLAGKLLGLILDRFFSILLLSNIITALSSFFLAKDLDLLVSGPVDWLKLYGAKLLETHRALELDGRADGRADVRRVRRRVSTAGRCFPLIVLATFLPFLIIPAVIGSAITLMLVNVFPARRTRDILSVIAVLAAGGIVLLFRIVRPERLARPEGFRSLVDFVTVLRDADVAVAAERVGAGRGHERGCRGRFDVAAVLPALDAPPRRRSCSARCCIAALYATGFSKAQESGERWARSGRHRAASARAVLRPLGVAASASWCSRSCGSSSATRRSGRSSSCSRVLVVVYVFNIKFLPLRGEGITFFLVNVIPFLNLVLAGFVLASIAARFIFPGVSLEGRTLWLLRSSPMSMRDLLWAKFWVGTLPLLILALGIVGVTNYLLQVSAVHVRRLGAHDRADDVRARGTRDRLRHAVSAVRDGERGADPDVVRRAAVHDDARSR